MVAARNVREKRARVPGGTGAELDVASLEETLARSLSLADVARATRTSMQTVARWCDVGLRGRDGSTRRLRSIRVGVRRYISPEALSEFLEGLNE
jgi:hypothetical protein